MQQRMASVDAQRRLSGLPKAGAVPRSELPATNCGGGMGPIYSYDVGLQLPRWSIPNFNTGAIDVADVDGGLPELIIGDGQWGTVHVHDLSTQALKWEVNNPEHGVTNIAVGDADHDGVVELLWVRVDQLRCRLFICGGHDRSARNRMAKRGPARSLPRASNRRPRRRWPARAGNLFSCL